MLFNKATKMVKTPAIQFESSLNLVAIHLLQSKALEQQPIWFLSPSNRQISSLQVLKLMTKTYDLSGREKGPPKISKLDTINKQINKVIVMSKITELFIATFTFFQVKIFFVL